MKEKITKVYITKPTFMASTSEKGHAKNAANFEVLISNVTSLGEVYNPSKELIKLSSLTTMSTSAENALSVVNTALSAKNNASSNLAAVVKPIGKLFTRVINALASSGVSSQILSTARSINRKIQGASNKEVVEGEQDNGISTSQMDLDSRLGNIDKLIKFLEQVPQYKPNEADLSITGLTTFYDNLKAKNAAAVAANTALNNARIARDKLFYTEETGMVDTAQSVKAYVKSIFGAESPEYIQVSKLKFTVVK